MQEIWLFLGKAVATEQNASGLPAGERHAIIVFLRQARGSEADFARARAIAQEKGWTDIGLEQAALLDVETLNSSPEFAASYESALERGYALVVFSDPL